MKQFLTLMLAFIMVFTGMGIGSWGVDTAWAATKHYYPTITYTDKNDNVTKITLTSNESIGEWSYGADNKSDLFLVTLPVNAEITSLTLENVDSSLQTWEIAGAKKYLEVEGEYPKISEIRSSVECLVNDAFRMCEYDDDECNYGYLLKDYQIGTFTNKISIDNVEGYIVYCFISGGYMKNDIATPGIIIQYPLGGGDETIDNEIEEKVGEKIVSEPDKWYHENDKFNGRQFSSTGFWTDMQEALTTARGVLGNSDSTEEDKAAAISKLKEKIANLIPTSQLNATKLYEALRPLYWISSENQATYEELSEHWKVTADNCTQASWTAYMQTREPAEAYLAKLFDKDGNATAFNKAEAAKGDQPGETEADKLADAIDPAQLVNQEKYDTAYQNWKKREAEANSLLVQYDPAKLREANYTKPSWKTYTDTYHALKEIAEYRIIGGTRADYDMLHSLYQNGDWLTNLLPESYNKLESKEGVTVTLQYTNGLAAAYPAVRGNGTDAYSGEISLAKGSTTVKDALAQTKITVHIGTGISGVLPKVTGSSFDSASKAWFAVYINDEFRGVYQNVSSLSKVYLKNDDSIRVNRIVQPLFESEESSGMTSSAIYRLPADASMYQDSAAVIGIDSITTDLKVGDKAKLQLSLKDAYGTDSGTQRSAEGITLFVSETPGKTEDTAGQPTRKTIAVTNASGNAEYVFAEEGWYWVAAHNVTPDKYYFQNIYRETTDGIYYSLQCGDAMLVYVSANEDESALIAAQRNENLAKAKAFYESFQAHDFPAGYYAGDFKIAYENLKTHQNEATTFKALMDSFEADYADLQLCAEQKLDHDARIASLRENLSYVPEDLSEFNDGDKDFIESVQHAYADLNDYEKTLLTPREITKLDEIAAIDVEKLTIRASVNLVENASTLPLNTDSTQGAAQFGFENNKWLTQPNPDGTLSNPDWVNGVGWKASLSKAGNYVFIRKFLKPTDKEYWMVWSIDGWKTKNLAEPQTLKNVHGVAFDGYFLVKYQIPKDITDGSTITFDLKMVDKATYESLAGITETSEQLAAAKTAALESLKAAYQAYDEANYTPDNWTALTAAYEKGRTDIEAAATSEAAADARKAAIAAMATIAAKGGSENPSVTDYDSGKTVGKVSVTIENTKYAGGAFTGTIASGQYDLGENDSMMTCVLKALKQAGYTWNGTAGSSKDKLADYSITYLSLIQKGGKSLGEFDGNSRSGWMGTLNDWFTNEGFSAFTVKNGQLENGDEIHVMFTMDYGADLGGTWNNNNTKLAGLTISGGTLSPAFSGSQTDYTLIISGDKANVSVTPSAANKNYQARIFLNRYNQDSARYKRTESISVKSGDVLYVGVGEKGWPTMNAGGVGTKYTIKVVSSSDSAAVDKMLKSLKKITYANYKAEKGNVEAARAAYNALDAEGKQAIAAADLKKLTDAEAQIKFYTEIDDVKAKLNALTDSSSRSQTKAALDAYEKLSEEQKQYITMADAAKYKELSEKYGLSGISGAVEMPESEVETTGKTGSATTTSPTEVKMSGTTASVTVKADNQKEILKQAKEKKSAQVVLVVANSDTKGAEKLEMNLDKSFLESLLKDTSAKLVVKTPLGQKTYERDELQKLVNETTGTTVKAEINKDNVDAQTEEPIDDNAAKIAKAKSIVKDLKLVARSSKTAKKNIKAVLKSDAKVKASIKELKDLGFTVKYRFYRSTKKAASYKAAVTKKTAAYTNTSGKKGTKYFYKVQARVYDENGKLVAKTALKQCKYASRTWTK